MDRPEDPEPAAWPDARAPQTPTPPGGAPRAAPVARPPTSTDERRQWAMFAHLAGFAWVLAIPPFVGPLIVWLMKRETDPFIDAHGREALNFQITMTIAWAVSVVLMIVLIGLLLLPVVLVFAIVFPIMGAMAANRGEDYRYPISIRFVT